MLTPKTVPCSSCGRECSTHLIVCPDCGTPVGYTGDAFVGHQLPRATVAASEAEPPTPASSHGCHIVLVALLGGLSGIVIGLIGVVAVGLEQLGNTPGLGAAMIGVSNPEAISPEFVASALAPCGAPCDHAGQAVILILWFTALAFGGGILSALAAIVPRFAGAMMLAVAGGMLALVVLAYMHLTQSIAESLSGVGLFFGIIPPVIFLWGGFQTGVFSLLPYSYLERLGNRMIGRAKSWRRP